MARRNSSLFTNLNIASPFDSLPPEILSHILSYLPYHSIKSARSVCVKWYLSSLTPRLIDKEKFVLKCRGSARVLRVLPIDCASQIIDSKREFFHLEIQGNADAEWFDVQFFSQVGRKLKSLTVRPVVTTSDDLFKSLKFFPNLRHLSIKIDEIVCSLDDASAISNSSPDLEKLETLELTRITDSNIGIIQMMVSKAPNLKSIHLKEIMLCDFSANDVMASLTDFPDHVFDFAVRLLNEDSIKITVAKRQREDLDLNVRLCVLTTVGFPEWLSSWNPTCMKELGVFKGLNNDQFALICKSFPNLEKLFIIHLRDVTAGGDKLASLKKLKCLSLRAVLSFDDEVLLAGLCSEVNTTLKDVSFHFMTQATSKFFIQFARTHPALTHLTIDNCEGVNDRSVQAFFKYQTSLQVFRIPGCKVTDVGLTGTEMQVPWNTVECENPTGYGLSRLADLRELELRAARMTGSIFQTGAKFKDLNKLGLSFSQVTLKTLGLIFDKHPAIRKLDVSKLPITDRFVGVILRKLPLLEKIRINECTNVTIVGIRQLLDRGVLLTHSNQWDLI